MVQVEQEESEVLELPEELLVLVDLAELEEQGVPLQPVVEVVLEEVLAILEPQDQLAPHLVHAEIN